MVSEKLLQKLLNKADFEIISPRFINWYQLRECWQFTKQLRRIYDSTLDRRPLSGKVIWRKISELKKTDVKWLQMSQKRKSERREICLRIWGICGCGEIESLATCRFLSILAKSFGYCPCLYMFYIEFSEIPTCTF